MIVSSRDDTSTIGRRDYRALRATKEDVTTVTIRALLNDHRDVSDTSIEISFFSVFA